MCWNTQLVSLGYKDLHNQWSINGGYALQGEEAVDKAISDAMSILIGRYGWCEPVSISYTGPFTIGSNIWTYITILAKQAPMPQHPAPALQEGG